jgi:hypothetical protein
MDGFHKIVYEAELSTTPHSSATGSFFALSCRQISLPKNPLAPATSNVENSIRHYL